MGCLAGTLYKHIRHASVACARPWGWLVRVQARWVAQRPRPTCYPAIAGTVLPDGSEVAAPSSLSGMFSGLSTIMEMLGRHGPWDEEARTGNPALCKDVTLYKSGYRRTMHAAGYEEGSAVEWHLGEVQALVEALDREAAAQLQLMVRHLAAGQTSSALGAVVACLMLDRDALAATYLWEGQQRGKECGRLAWDDLALPDGTPLPRELPFPAPVGYQVRCSSNSGQCRVAAATACLTGRGVGCVRGGR